MQVKYASRHVLYPVPKVLELDVSIVTRAVLETAERDLVFVVSRVVTTRGVRVVALRAVVVVLRVVVVRTVLVVGCDATRAFVEDDVVLEDDVF